jgi:predicted Ser/Thr protein kinase
MKCESCGHENLDDARFCAGCGVLVSRDTGGEWIGRLVGGRFRVTHVLGEGGMGVVYGAEQQMGSTIRKAAIKTLHPHLSKDPSVLARFHRECGTVAQLEHPNTIKVFDFGAEADGTLYIAMEFVEGRSLDKVIEADGPLPPARVVDILEQVAGALNEAHGQGIVHRDLKPENVILGEKLGKTDFVKVLDFGIAARSESADRQKEQKLTQQGMVLGTPPYMSPEQFTGAELDLRSDIYSLGVMTYEMLTGSLPFNATTPWQWATEHMTAQPFPIEQRPSGYGVPKSMREAVMRSLAKEPAQRPATAQAFVAELKASMVGTSVSATEATQAMQAVLPNARAVVDVSAKTGAVPALGPASTLRSAEAPETEAGLSVVQPIGAKRSNVGVLVGALGAVALLVGAAWFVGMGPGSAPAAAPEDEPQDPAAAALPSVAPEPPAPNVAVTPTPAPAPVVTAQAPPTPQPTPPPSTATTAPPKSTSTPAAAPVPCSECIGLVGAGSWGRATLAYGSCDAAGQKQCSAKAKREAPEQAERAAAAHKCSQAQAILKGATALGAVTSRVRTAAEKCR